MLLGLPQHPLYVRTNDFCFTTQAPVVLEPSARPKSVQSPLLAGQSVAIATRPRPGDRKYVRTKA
jgi:hypothetical protein